MTSQKIQNGGFGKIDPELLLRCVDRFSLSFFVFELLGFLFTIENPYLGDKFWGFLDPINPKMVNYHLDPPMALPYTRTRVLSHNLHGRFACGDL